MTDEVDGRPELERRVNAEEPEGHAQVGKPLEPGIKTSIFRGAGSGNAN